MNKTCWVAIAAAFTIFAGAASHARADSDLAYFQQFLYKKETHDDGDGDVQVQYRQLLGDQEIQIDPNHILIAHVELYLNADMTSTFRYTEMLKSRDNDHSDWQYMPGDMCPTQITGAWSVPERELILGAGDAIVGARDVWHTQNAVKLTFKKALKNPALAGQSITLSYGYSSQDKDSMMPPFCH